MATTTLKDEHYDIVSTLYHSLQGASICDQYIKDAQKEGDDEALKFFKEVQDTNNRLADKAKKLLVSRVH